MIIVTFISDQMIFSFAPRRRGQDLLFVTRVALFGIHASLNFLMALTIKLQREAVATKEKTTSGIVSSSGSLGGGGHRRRGSRLVASLLTGEYGDSPNEVYIGNTAACMALVLSLSMHMYFFEGNETCIIFLAPILLLLNQDSTIMAGLTSQRRYFPLLLGTHATTLCVALISFTVCGDVW